MAKTVDWAAVKNRASRHALFYLNDYFDELPRLRIEEKQGGDRCLWKAKTTENKMVETKRYLEKVWQLDKTSNPI